MSIQVVSNIATLRTITGSGNDVADVLGYYTPNDGGGGEFYWDAASTTADNGGTIIKATSTATGRWIRLVEDKIDVKWFGATGDGVTDDTQAIQNAIDILPGSPNNGGQIFFSTPADFYRISDKLVIENTWVHIVGESKGVQIVNVGSDVAFEIAGEPETVKGFYTTFRDISILGDGSENGAGATGLHGIHFINTNNFVLDNVVIRYHGGNGVYCTGGIWVGSFINTEISQCYADGVHSVSPSGDTYDQNGNAFSFVNCTLAYNNGSGLNWKASALNVAGCTIEGNQEYGILVDCTGLTNSAYGMNIVGNYFEANLLGELKFISISNTIVQGLEISGNHIYSNSEDATSLITFEGPANTTSGVHIGKNGYVFGGTVVNAVDGGNSFRQDCFIDDSFKVAGIFPFINLGNARSLNRTVDTNTDQTITGTKTFDADIILKNAKGLRWYLSDNTTLKYILRLTSGNATELFGGTGGILLKSSGNVPLLTVSDAGTINVPFLSASLPVFTDASKNLTNTGSAKEKSAIKTSNYEVVTSDFGTNGLALIYADSSSAAIEITLPLSTDLVNLCVMVVKIDSTANAVTIKRKGSDVINGLTTDVLNGRYSTGVYKASTTSGYIYKVLGQAADVKGTYTVTGAGQTTINIPHGLGLTPTFTTITPKSAYARAIAITSWTEDSTNIIITLASAAPSGNTLTYAWEAEV